MAAIDITNGPSKGELVTRMLSDLPVTFHTTGGPMDVLIEEMQETDASGDRVAFVGRIVVDAQTGARVEGQYDCQDKVGTVAATANGP
jgi:hypothetical protein